MVLCILLLKTFDTLSLLHLEIFQFFTVVHSLVDTLVHRDQLLVVLHDAQTERRLDLGYFDGAVQLAVQDLHLLFVLHLQALDLIQGFFLISLEALLPSVVELLHVLFSDSNVLTHLALLDVITKLVLEVDNLGFE